MDLQILHKMLNVAKPAVLVVKGKHITEQLLADTLGTGLACSLVYTLIAKACSQWYSKYATLLMNSKPEFKSKLYGRM